MRDDVDYVPTNRLVLWGHHFTTVAGAAPIIGPGIAVIWGWLPAFLWVVLGTVFFAGVHDFGAVWASIRHQARSVGTLTGDVVSVRARALFMVVIFFLLLMVNAVFAVAISDAFQATPSSVIPVWSAIIVAVIIGVLIYRMHVPITWPTIVGTAVLYAVIYLGELVPIELPATVAGLAPGAQWIVILFVYAAMASILPVWLLLQTARLHQRHPTLRRPGPSVWGRVDRESDDRRTGDQPEPACGGTAARSTVVCHDCLRSDLRIPWTRGLRHDVEAAQL